MTRLVLIAALGIVAGCGSPAVSAPRGEQARGEPTPPTTPAPTAALAPAPVEAPPDDGGEAVRVSTGSCDVAWLPPGMVVDVTDEQAASLVEAVREWAAPGGIRALMIESQRGIAWAKSEDDLGADPPYATHTRAQGGLACGVASRWLADHVQVAFARQASPDYGGVICEENVCCYAGMEFMSRGILVARLSQGPDAPRWVIDAHAEIAEATLSEEVIAANRAHVTRTLARHRRQSCPNEPAGSQ